jgi:predicted kinase
MAKLIMMIGIPGSGKTTYSKDLSKEYNAKVISSDKVRQTYVGIKENDVFPTVFRLCIEELKENRNVILDATHITPKVRKRTFDALDEFNVPYEKVAVYVDTPVDVCVRRVEKRNQDPNELFLPLEVITSYGNNIVPPSLSEGFIDIKVIKSDD